MKIITAYTSDQTERVKATRASLSNYKGGQNFTQLDLCEEPSLQYPSLILAALKRSERVMWVDPGTTFMCDPGNIPQLQGFDVVGITAGSLSPISFNPSVSTYTANECTMEFLEDWADACEQTKTGNWIDVLQREILFNDDYLMRGLDIAILPSKFALLYYKLRTAASQDLKATSVLTGALEPPLIVSWFNDDDRQSQVYASQQSIRLGFAGARFKPLKRPDTPARVFAQLLELHKTEKHGIYVIPPKTSFERPPYFLFDTHLDVVVCDDTGALPMSDHLFFAPTDAAQKVLEHLAKTAVDPMFFKEFKQDHGYADVGAVSIPKRIRNIMYGEI